MTDDDLQRYARHILLDEIAIEGQQRILAGTVLVVGLGGLGNPCAAYLAAAGVGTLVLCDGDTVDRTNLQRQTLFTERCVGQPKAEAGAERLRQLNPGIDIRTVGERLDDRNAAAPVRGADVVVDCSDNFATRHLGNRLCQ